MEIIEMFVAIGVPISLVASIALIIRSWVMLAEIQQLIAKLEPRVTELEKNQEGFRDEISEVYGKVDVLKYDVSEKVNGLSKNIDNLSKYMDAFAQSLGAIRESHAEWKAAFEREQTKLFQMWSSQFEHFSEEMRSLRKDLKNK